MGHKTVKCSCGKIIFQCRCMYKDKPVEVVKDGCEECKHKDSDIQLQAQGRQGIR